MKRNPFKTVRSLWHTVIPGRDPESRNDTDFIRFRTVPFAFRMITFFISN